MFRVTRINDWWVGHNLGRQRSGTVSLGSQVFHSVLIIRLVQWFSRVFATQEKKKNIKMQKSPVSMSYFIHVNEACGTHQRVMSLIYQWVTARVPMSHVTQFVLTSVTFKSNIQLWLHLRLRGERERQKERGENKQEGREARKEKNGEKRDRKKKKDRSQKIFMTASCKQFYLT